MNVPIPLGDRSVLETLRGMGVETTGTIGVNGVAMASAKYPPGWRVAQTDRGVWILLDEERVVAVLFLVSIFAAPPAAQLVDDENREYWQREAERWGIQKIEDVT